MSHHSTLLKVNGNICELYAMRVAMIHIVRISIIEKFNSFLYTFLQAARFFQTISPTRTF